MVPYLLSFGDNMEGELGGRWGGLMDFRPQLLSWEMLFTVFQKGGEPLQGTPCVTVPHIDSWPDLEKNSQKSGNSERMLSFHPLLTL